MNNNIFYTLHELNRKVLLLKILCNGKGKVIVDDLLENELNIMQEYIHKKEHTDASNRPMPPGKGK